MSFFTVTAILGVTLGLVGFLFDVPASRALWLAFGVVCLATLFREVG